MKPIPKRRSDEKENVSNWTRNHLLREGCVSSFSSSFPLCQAPVPFIQDPFQRGGALVDKSQINLQWIFAHFFLVPLCLGPDAMMNEGMNGRILFFFPLACMPACMCLRCPRGCPLSPVSCMPSLPTYVEGDSAVDPCPPAEPNHQIIILSISFQFDRSADQKNPRGRIMTSGRR